MVGLTIGSFAGGAAQGATQGADLRQRQQEIQATAAKLKQLIIDQQSMSGQLASALNKSPASGAPQGQPPIPGATPMPQGAMGGGAPAAAPQGPQPMSPGQPSVPGPQAAPPPQAGPPQAQGGLTPTPMPGATPMARPQQAAPPSAGGAPGGQPPQADGMSGVAAPTGVWADDLNKTFKSVAQDVAKGFPPGTPAPVIIAAIKDRIEMMKGLQGDDRAVLQYQAQMAKIQMQHQEDREKIQSAQDISIRNDARIRELTEANEKLKADIAAHHDQTLTNVGAGHDAAGVKRAGINASAGITKTGMQQSGATNRQDMKDKTNLAVADKKGDTTITAEQTRRMARENAAAIAAGQKPPYPQGAQAAGGAAGAGGKSSGSAQNPISVKTPQDAQKLPKGTYFKRPDGTVMVRQ